MKKQRSISTIELLELTKSNWLPQAICKVAHRMQSRIWRVAGKVVQWGGLNWKKDYVLFSLIESAGENAASYRCWRVSIADAVDCISGKLDDLASLERRA